MTNDALLRQVETLLRAGNLPQAMMAAREAAARGVVHPNVLSLAAMQELELGFADKALALAMRAKAFAPRNPDVLGVQARALAALGRHEEAVAVFEEVLRQAPRHAAAHYHKGLSLAELHEPARAERSFERAVEIEPRHAGALAKLAALAATRGEAGKARERAMRALAANPREVAAHLALAEADLGERGFDAARARLASLLGTALSPVNRAIAEGLLADALDGAGSKDEAFAHYVQSNRIQRELYRPAIEAQERAVARARRLARTLPSAAPAQAAAAPAHVFLIGMPRSGTTLLEQVLDAHPAVETLEERDCLAKAMNDFVLPLDGMQRLAEAPLEPYRKAYWDEARAGGATLDRAVFVDKLPLNALNLGLIARLFPGAKILLAVRDPRDVVLSCFRRRFQMSPNMYELLDLDDAARFYDAVMALVMEARERLPLAFHLSRYEDLVGDLPARAAALCDFLGVAYDGAMLDFAGRARARGINTPSAAQVARGLYNSGMGQWRAYARHLSPVMPVLAPWVARLGYEEN